MPDMDPRLDRLLDEFESDRDEGRTPKVLHAKIDQLDEKVEGHSGRITTLEAHRQRDAEDRGGGWGPNGTGRHQVVPGAGVAVHVEAAKPHSYRPSWISEGLAGAAKRVAPAVGAVIAAWVLGHFITAPAAARSAPTTVATVFVPMAAMTASASVEPEPVVVPTVDASAHHRDAGR
jgi:hypothetical protein